MHLSNPLCDTWSYGRPSAIWGAHASPRVGFGVSPKQAFEKVRGREDAITSTRDACAPQKVHVRARWYSQVKIFFARGVRRVLLYLSPALRANSANVGYAWIVDAILPSPIFAFIASTNSCNKSPACGATIVAPRILSEPFAARIFAKPSSSLSTTARSTSSKGTKNKSYSIFASFSLRPTCATSGSV